MDAIAPDLRRRIRVGPWTLRVLFLLVGNLLPCTWSAAAAGVTLTDDRGRQVELPAAPQRVVSLLPSLTEIVCALQACGRLVAVDRYADWPEAVRALPRVGGLEDTQIERVLALKPDLVLVAVS